VAECLLAVIRLRWVWIRQLWAVAEHPLLRPEWIQWQFSKWLRKLYNRLWEAALAVVPLAEG
jgi:hypothetical protein